MKATGIVLLDLFSGTGGFVKGFLEAGYTFRKHYFSEVDKYAIANYSHNFNDATYAGPVETITGGIEHPDIITFGFPCQDLSVAGGRAGLEGSRSGLFFEAVRIVRQHQPRVFVFENVKGLLSSNGGKDFEIVLKAIADLGLYDCEWQLLNTRWFLPQNRERVYFVGHLRGESTRQVFPFQESDFPTSGMEARPVAGAVVAFYTGTPNIGTYITDAMEKNKPVNARKLTPTECERLQGFPDDWTRYGLIEGQVIEISDSQRYKMLGNAVSVPVVQAIAQRLASDRLAVAPVIPIQAATEIQEAVTVDDGTPAESVGALVENHAPEIRFIKRYIALHNTTKSPAAVLTFIKDLQSAITKKLIRKASPYADEIDLIQDKLISVFQKMKGNERFAINKKDLTRMTGIVNGGAHKSCSCEQDIGRIYDGRKRGTRKCLKGTYSDARGKGTCSHNHGLNGVLTAEQMANRTFEMLHFTDPWRALLGTPARNFTLMLHGEPGAGKTSLLLKLAEYLAVNFGKVMYISSEEFESVTFT
jgi:DNA (cytosine-5)-methyltransferase 1